MSQSPSSLTPNNPFKNLFGLRKWMSWLAKLMYSFWNLLMEYKRANCHSNNIFWLEFLAFLRCQFAIKMKMKPTKNRYKNNTV
jgi:hypothetical protein